MPRPAPSPSPAAADLTDVLQFMRGLWALVHALQKASKRMGQHVGVTGPQRLVLRVVGLRPGLSAGELATILHVHPSTLTGVLKRLIAQRLVARSAYHRDRRRAVLSLTPLGARVNTIRKGTVEAAVRHVLGRVPLSERRVTQAVLTRIAERLTNPPSRPITAASRPRSPRRAA